MKARSNQLQNDFLKKSLRLNNHFHLQNLNKKKRGWQKEALRVIDQGQIGAQSPFLALALNPGAQEEALYIAPDLFYPKEGLKEEGGLNQDQLKEGPPLKNQSDQNKDVFLDSDKKGASIKKTGAGFKVSYGEFLSQIKKLIKSAPPSAYKNQELALTKAPWPSDKEQNKKWRGFVFSLSSFEENNRWVALLKDEKPFFAPPSLLESRNKNQEAFIVSQKGLILMSDKRGAPSGALSKKSPLRQILQQMTNDLKIKSRYLKTSDKTGRLYFYHIQKWGRGGLFLVSRQSAPMPVFSWKNIYFKLGLISGALLFVLAFRLALVRLFSLLAAYRFLKRSFLIFNKTGLFPESPKNPLLYFYNNRKMFLNQRQKENSQKGKETVVGRFNIREIIRQEAQKLKARFPLIDIREDFDFDTRVFGFERFFRSLVYELLLNSLEAMGGLKNPKLDLSLREKEGNLIFSIRDYGVGIRPQDRDKVFRVYYSTKSQTGVGLNFVQSVVKANGGSLRFDTPKDGGCLAEVCLPVQCFLKSG